MGPGNYRGAMDNALRKGTRVQGHGQPAASKAEQVPSARLKVVGNGLKLEEGHDG